LAERKGIWGAAFPQATSDSIPTIASSLQDGREPWQANVGSLLYIKYLLGGADMTKGLFTSGSISSIIEIDLIVVPIIE
jgi:hypothetical protein